MNELYSMPETDLLQQPASEHRQKFYIPYLFSTAFTVTNNFFISILNQKLNKQLQSKRLRNFLKNFQVYELNARAPFFTSLFRSLKTKSN